MCFLLPIWTKCGTSTRYRQSRLATAWSPTGCRTSDRCRTSWSKAGDRFRMYRVRSAPLNYLLRCSGSCCWRACTPWFVWLVVIYAFIQLAIPHQALYVWRVGNTINILHPDLSWGNVCRIRQVTDVCMFSWTSMDVLGLLLWLFDLAPRECTPLGSFACAFTYWPCVFSLRRTLAAMCCPVDQ